MREATGDAATPEVEGGDATTNRLNAASVESVVQARNVRDINFHLGTPPEVRVPHQLLSPPPHFTGREAELARLRELATGREPKLIVITGVGGVGKTSIALRLLHEVKESYAYGQLYADLRGFSPGGPAAPGEILGQFLRSLGVRPDGVPVDEHERANLFRSLTDGRPVTLLLDNAVSAAQARALLPGSGPHLVVVTSRRHIAGLSLDGARFTDLAPLDEQAAVELLERIIGSERATSEPEAARSLVDMCDRLPLAVCASAARLAPRPHWSIGRMAEELANERRRLTALSVVEDLSVRAAFDISYHALPEGAARLYRRLGLLPVASFGVEAAAAAAGIEAVDAGELLETLVEANLIEEIGHERFRYHDLVRLHARDQAESDPSDESLATVARSVDWYLRTVVAADLRILPARWRLGRYYEHPPETAVTTHTSADAIEWLEAELPNILAVMRWAEEHELDDAVWQLCEALWGLFTLRKHYDAWIESHLIGVRSAEKGSDPRATARMHVQLGSAYRSLRRFEEALDHFGTALRLERDAGHRLGEGSVLDHLGVVMLRLERYEEAIEHFHRSRAIHEEVEVPRGVALMNFNIGQALGHLGRYSEALDCLELAGRQFAAVPEPYHEARTMTSLAEMRIRSGRPAEAARPLERALAVLTELGATYDQAHVRTRLADLAEALGETGNARVHLEQAFLLFTTVRAPQAEQVRGRLEDLGVSPGASPGSAGERAPRS